MIYYILVKTLLYFNKKQGAKYLSMVTKRATKFKPGDLIIYPKELDEDPSDDYGIVTDITWDIASVDYYYHIYWSIEGEETCEVWDWAEENFWLVCRA